MNVQAIKTEIFSEGQDLVAFLVAHLPKDVPEKSIILVTSKIVALAEGRVRQIDTDEEREALIREEADFVMRGEYTWLTLKDNMVMNSAGVDRSNSVDGKTILLPMDSFASADMIRHALRNHYNITDLGVIITDSRLLPLRSGVCGVPLGYAGFQGFRDERGLPDLFDRQMKTTRIDVVSALSTAGVLVMGEGNEQQPVALITDYKAEFTDTIDRHALDIDIKNDVYQPLFEIAKDIDIEK